MVNKKFGGKIKKGVVVKNKIEKMVTVEVSESYRHPKYKKVLNRRKKYLVHSDKDVKVGDEVVIQECRPYSKHVKWKIFEIKTEE